MSGCSGSLAGCAVSSSLDNLKAGVHRASFYDPEINRSYGMMASHYDVGILPARKPRDKAKVEAGVRFDQTYILGRLRRQTFFFSLAEANAAIAAALERINAHVMRRIGVSRRQLFETVESLSWRRCRMPTISSRNGSWPASRSIVTSGSTASSTQCHTA
ncbi:hypothetical protein ACVWXO_000756 [Bradyrhizobium sp. LM2.7]